MSCDSSNISLSWEGLSPFIPHLAYWKRRTPRTKGETKSGDRGKHSLMLSLSNFSHYFGRMPSVEKLKSLHTHHDPYFLHKGLGILALAHFVGRFSALLLTGSMWFRAGDPGTLLGILLHAALANSAFIFHTPERRTQVKPMMWREFQLHSITFSMRSLLVMFTLWTGFWANGGLSKYRGVVVLAAHLTADAITRRYKQGTTMRDMPFPSSLSRQTVQRINLFYSLSQIFAVCGVLLMGLEEAFMILFPIQIAAFLLTLVRKDVISAGTWHLVYGTSLLLPYLYLLIVLPPATSMELIVLGFIVSLLRFRLRINKYLLWGPVALLYLIRPPMYSPTTGCMHHRWDNPRLLTPTAVAVHGAVAGGGSSDTKLLFNKRALETLRPRSVFKSQHRGKADVSGKADRGEHAPRTRSFSDLLDMLGSSRILLDSFDSLVLREALTKRLDHVFCSFNDTCTKKQYDSSKKLPASSSASSSSSPTPSFSWMRMLRST